MKKNKAAAVENDGSMSLSGHLRELRNRVAVCVVVLVLGFFGCLSIAGKLVTMLTDLGTAYQYNYVYIAPQELLLVYFNLALIGAVVITFPVLAYEAYAFASPGLSRRERTSIALALLVGYWYWMNRRLRKKNEALAVARDKAQESSRMKSAFIKNISHEIRTPLNILSGFAQILSLDTEQPLEIRQEASRNIQENTNRITSLVNRLLDLSESSSRNSIERSDNISANQLCQEAIRQSGIADKPQHKFSFVSSVDDTVMVQTSMHYATSALVHLLDNAEKFTPEGGSITMKCETREKMLYIGVEDTGCGVPKDKADTIFDEFVQLDEYKDGVGIGLTLSRNIIRRLGGDIVLDATCNKGARFFVMLPL